MLRLLLGGGPSHLIPAHARRGPFLTRHHPCLFGHPVAYHAARNRDLSRLRLRRGERRASQQHCLAAPHRRRRCSRPSREMGIPEFATHARKRNGDIQRQWHYVSRDMHRLREVLLLLFVITSTRVDARTTNWVLSGVTFTDGGTALGRFSFDTDSSTITNWDITVVGGNTTVFPPQRYSTDNSSVLPFSGAVTGFTFRTFVIGGPRDLKISPVGSLDTAGYPSVALGGSGDNLECFNCSPLRVITAGAVQRVDL